MNLLIEVNLPGGGTARVGRSFARTHQLSPAGTEPERPRTTVVRAPVTGGDESASDKED